MFNSFKNYVQWIIDKIGGRLRKKEEIEEQRCVHMDVIKYASGVLVSKIEHLSIAFVK
jgi:hypothetical protein